VQRDWENYHLIGDALRQPDHICKTFGQSFHERLQAEPTVFAPYKHTSLGSEIMLFRRSLP
jgi:sigma-E factor negative regulatory protein RseA